jgi:hypothetical protein
MHVIESSRPVSLPSLQLSLAGGVIRAEQWRLGCSIAFGEELDLVPLNLTPVAPVARLQRSGFRPRRMLHRNSWPETRRGASDHRACRQSRHDWFGRSHGIRQGAQTGKALVGVGKPEARISRYSDSERRRGPGVR